jgi:tetratricopeptide (TPR) repeat protein
MKTINILLFLMTVSTFAATGDPAALPEAGHEALVRGDYDAAVAAFERAVQLQPRVAALHFRLGGAYAQSAMDGGLFGGVSMAKKARAEFERAVELDADLLPARFALLEFYLGAPGLMGGSESAARAQAVEIAKRDAVEGHRSFATIDVAAKQPELARAEYAAMLREQPRSARAHYYYGLHLLLIDKHYTSATAEFETSAKLDTSYAAAWFQIGHSAALGGTNLARGEEALRHYLTAKIGDDDPPYARAHYWLGTIYEKQGRSAEAKASYVASLRINAKQKDVAAAIRRVS